MDKECPCGRVTVREQTPVQTRLGSSSCCGPKRPEDAILPGEYDHTPKDEPKQLDAEKKNNTREL